MNNQRGTGRTTQQMQEAPPQAIYIWCNGRRGYPTDLAKSLHRDDLTIISPAQIELFFRGRQHGIPIVIDHACHLTHQQYEIIWDYQQ